MGPVLYRLQVPASKCFSRAGLPDNWIGGWTILTWLRRHYRYVRRYQEIGRTLTRHGFDYLLAQLGQTEIVARSRRMVRLGRQDRTLLQRSAPERLRLVLEELGPAFIKLGQVLSTRGDLVGEPYLRELEKLQDEVSSVATRDIVRCIEEELGRTVDETFAWFENEPLAAASIAQVHRAALPSGEQVVVKVLRPGVRDAITIDLAILRELAALAERRTFWGRAYGLEAIAEEFAAEMAEETDLRAEGRHTEIIRRNLEHDARIVVPKVFWDYTTAGVLTLEYLPGAKLRDLAALQRMRADRINLARVVADTVLQQMLLDGVFHADPHPGNLLVQPDGRVGFLDFGIVGHLTREMRDNLGRMLLALIRKDADQVVRAVMSMGVVPADTTGAFLRRDVERLQHKYYEVPLSQVSVSEALRDLMNAARRNHIRLPGEIALVIKALVTLDGVVQILDPTVSIVDIARPLGMRLVAERYSASGLQRWVEDKLSVYAEVFAALPIQIHRLLEQAERGTLRLRHDDPAVGHLAREVAQTGRYLGLVLVAGTLIVSAPFIRMAELSLFGFDPAVPCLAAGLGVAAVLLWVLMRRQLP